ANSQANISAFPESPTTDRLGPAILRSCPELKKLKVRYMSDAGVGILAATLKSHLRKLRTIELDGYFYFARNTDSVMAEMLSACHAGWKYIRISVLGVHSVEALIKHCPTLEALEVGETPGWSSAHMHQILSSCPKIHTFVTMDDGEYRVTHKTHFLAKDFIDFDQASSSLAAWK
ncbi:hypothetical protein BGZ59_005273, partial [Podila verticillata]